MVFHNPLLSSIISSIMNINAIFMDDCCYAVISASLSAYLTLSYYALHFLVHYDVNKSVLYSNGNLIGPVWWNNVGRGISWKKSELSPRARENPKFPEGFIVHGFLGEFIATNIDIAHGEYISMVHSPSDSPFIFIRSWTSSYGNVNKFHFNTVNLLNISEEVALEKFARSANRCEIHNVLWFFSLERSSVIERRGILLVYTFGN